MKNTQTVIADCFTLCQDAIDIITSFNDNELRELEDDLLDLIQRSEEIVKDKTLKSGSHHITQKIGDRYFRSEIYTDLTPGNPKFHFTKMDEITQDEFLEELYKRGYRNVNKLT